PSSFVDLAQGNGAQDVIPSGGMQLTGSKQTSTFGVHVDQSGQVDLDLNAFGPHTDWGKDGSESAVVSVYVDGKYKEDQVLFGGADKTKYSLSLGELDKGDHAITLRYAPEKSAGGQGVTIDSGTATAMSYKNDNARWADQYSPIVIGRHGTDNNHTDVPLGLNYSAHKNPDGSTDISYAVTYSNEDGGTGGQPSMEQAQWGRLTDIQHISNVTVNVDPQGKAVSYTYEGANHVNHPFQGNFDGTHPIVITDTLNNDVIDTGDGPLRFEMPAKPMPAQGAGELMRLNPQWFQVEGKELEREHKLDPKGNGDLPVTSTFGLLKDWIDVNVFDLPNQMADPRNYLYVQFRA
ncbi:MAG: hypothetical protein ACRD3W_18055, partial [Terriglobales bacterium]